jgi:hypothetical protein
MVEKHFEYVQRVYSDAPRSRKAEVIRSVFVNDALSEYEDWDDINNPIDEEKKKLKKGDSVAMVDFSAWGGRDIDNKWEIKKFSRGSSAGVEASIENKDGAKRSEPCRYLRKL